MHQRTQPHPHTMGSSKLALADQTMDPAVPIPALRVRGQLILFNPVDFEVAEGLAVEAPDGRKAMFGGEVGGEKLRLVGDGTLLAPAVRHARVVHPFVQEFGIGHESRVFGAGGAFAGRLRSRRR